MINSISDELNLLARLDNLDWIRLLLDTGGLTKKMLLTDRTIALQLASGAMTDLICLDRPGNKHAFSLRASFPQKDSGDLGHIEVFERMPICDRDLLMKGEQRLEFLGYNFNDPESLESIFGTSLIKIKKDNVTIDWPVRSYANLGSLWSFPDNLQKWLLSFHSPTNRLVGMTYEDVVKQLQADRTFYRVLLDDKSIERLANGECILIRGCRYKNLEFSTYAQFDVAKNQVVPAYPSWEFKRSNEVDSFGRSLLMQDAADLLLAIDGDKIIPKMDKKKTNAQETYKRLSIPRETGKGKSIHKK